METCHICQADMAPLFVRKLLYKYDVRYFHCAACGYVRTEQPYWLQEAYSDAIAVADTGIMYRNQQIAKRLAPILYFCFDARGSYLDVAGGYGILTRLMRDNGFDYYWQDGFCANLVARGFEADKARSKFAALTGFEVIEHTPNPVEFVAEIMERHRCRNFIFSTETYAGPQPPKPDWWYLTPMTGQHISFFQERTLRRIAARLGLTFYSSRGIHIFADGKLRNASLLPMLTGSLAAPMSRLIRRLLGSRTMADYQAFEQRPPLPNADAESQS